MTRSLNKVTLIGNLTHDPELRYTPQGTAVCTFSIATNRQWTTDSGEKKDDAEFHRVVAWNKLAEICAQYLGKGRKVYVEGRLQTRDWKTKEGDDRQTTEIVINEMIILDGRGGSAPQDDFDVSTAQVEGVGHAKDKSNTGKSKGKSNVSKKTDDDAKDDDEDIPF